MYRTYTYHGAIDIGHDPGHTLALAPGGVDYSIYMAPATVRAPHPHL